MKSHKNSTVLLHPNSIRGSRAYNQGLVTRVEKVQGLMELKLDEAGVGIDKVSNHS